MEVCLVCFKKSIRKDIKAENGLELIKFAKE